MKKIIFLFSFLLFFFFATKSFASTEFSTNYNLKYNVAATQNTHVTINISLINKTDSYYASSYKIHVGFSDIKNIKATDSGGNILTNVSEDNGEKVINVKFNDRVVGINNKLNFTISFDTDEIAKKLGSIWEVNIPGLSENSDVTNFNVSVTVPSSFGKAAFIKPSVKPENSGNVYNFDRSDLGSSGISITFGDKQIYDFDLTYHIFNENLFPVKTEVALPPDTNYQTVQIDDISPAPSNVRIDDDGNWLAEYSLSPSEKKDIKVKTKIKVGLSPLKQSETPQSLKKYLKEDKNWQINDPKLKEKAKNLKSAYEVYKFVSEYLSYDYSRVTSQKPRLGARSAFESPKSAVCLEFTDLFIALARAAGIPAREIDGFAYTENSKERPLSLVKDVLHAWPQYYDNEKNTWVMIDPTWANTTQGLDYFNVLDFDHVAFVIKGEESTYPIPAGGYKYPGKETIKDVHVSFTGQFEDKNSSLELIDNLPKETIAGFKTDGEILIKNVGKFLSTPQTVLIETDKLNPKTKMLKLDPIPPYGHKTLDVFFESTSFLTNTPSVIKITIGESVFIHAIKVIPVFLDKRVIIGGLIFFGILIVIISAVAFKPWNLFVSKPKGDSSLRGESEKSTKKSI